MQYRKSSLCGDDEGQVRVSKVRSDRESLHLLGAPDHRLVGRKHLSLFYASEDLRAALLQQQGLKDIFVLLRRCGERQIEEQSVYVAWRNAVL